MEALAPLEPVDVLHLFPRETDKLLSLLADLSPGDWARETVCPGWSVKDIVQHLLADDLGRLSGQRDGYRQPVDGDLSDWETLLAFINRQNEQWVAATRRLSPRLLRDLLAFSRAQTQPFFESLDLTAIGMPVNWAGPDPAPVWLDVAREYTERWLHQQHIRQAVDRPGAQARAVFHPVLATFVHALPYTYRDVERPPGTAVVVEISGEAGGVWTLRRETAGWRLWGGRVDQPAASVTLDQDIAWRVWTRGLTPEGARPRLKIAGDEGLGYRTLEAVAIIA